MPREVVVSDIGDLDKIIVSSLTATEARRIVSLRITEIQSDTPVPEVGKVRSDEDLSLIAMKIGALAIMYVSIMNDKAVAEGN